MHIRTKPGLAQAWRTGGGVVGLLCVALGFALAVLPGPLTAAALAFWAVGHHGVVDRIREQLGL